MQEESQQKPLGKQLKKDKPNSIRSKTLEEFTSQTEALYAADPNKTRYQIKYREVDGKLRLKTTNDKKCYSLIIDDTEDIKKLEALNSLVFRCTTGFNITEQKKPVASSQQAESSAQSDAAPSNQPETSQQPQQTQPQSAQKKNDKKKGKKKN
ncbi:signal recognition particle 9 kDa protein [Acrasis kona]|uniref:Signal recognition particle 9 kDa protein n=1 Tax=Acrasis kona TaxID=1008807 RepID=A0AAW2Z945_9EUKA